MLRACDFAFVPNNEPFGPVAWNYTAEKESHDFTWKRSRRPTESWPVAAVRKPPFALWI